MHPDVQSLHAILMVDSTKGGITQEDDCLKDIWAQLLHGIQCSTHGHPVPISDGVYEGVDNEGVID